MDVDPNGYQVNEKVEGKSIAMLLVAAMISSGVSFGTFHVVNTVSQPANANVTNNYYNTTNYYDNNTSPAVDHVLFKASVVLNQTRTFFGMLNMSLARRLTVREVFAKVNATIPCNPGCGQVEFTYKAYVDGSELGLVSTSDRSFTIEAGVVGTWQGESAFLPNDWAFLVSANATVVFGAICWDGYNPVNPVNLGVEFMVFYDVE